MTVPNGTLHAGTLDAYERGAATWEAARSASSLDRANVLTRSAATAGPRGPSLDLGCGPGWHLPALPEPVIALDAVRAMLELVPGHAPAAPRVQADMARLPFAPASIGSALAAKSYVHLDGRSVPRALADLHRCLAGEAPVALTFFGSGPSADKPSVTGMRIHGDDFAGRRFSLWASDDITAVLEGAGFDIEITIEPSRDGHQPHLWATGHRRRTLPDTVGPGMRLLVCGLNPSLHAADAGIGFVTPGNRFWPAAVAAGLVTRDRDPFHALDAHGIGMTDLAKRATRRADELSSDEYRDGLGRVEHLVRWLSPGAICFVGLAGYRVAIDRRAQAGPQSVTLGGRPVYVMPSTSGLNAHSRLEDLTVHLRAASALAS